MRAPTVRGERFGSLAPMSAAADPSREPPQTDPEVRRSSTLKAIVRTARPKQWTKNVLVFAAPAAAGVLDQRDALLQTLVAFVGFCLAASGTYFLNDANDAAADRLHPTKRMRPIAAESLARGLFLPSDLVAATRESRSSQTRLRLL